MKKKRIVLNDKDKIASVIKELDEKKNEALRNAWKKVNKVSGLFPLTKFRTIHLLYSIMDKNEAVTPRYFTKVKNGV